ncbi:MAG: AAA family ATPase [Saprospirales bacterium]|nr:AAA family ATPase [Saprospirales bacterium]
MKESLLAQLFFGELEKTHARPAGAERVASIYHLLQQLFLERTKQEQLHFNTLFARMSYTLQKYQIDGFLQANLQYFRKMAQEYPSPGVDGHALARLGFTVLAKAISFLYEAPIPESIYSQLLDPLPSPPHWAPISEFRKQMRVLVVRDEPGKQQLTGYEEERPQSPLLIRYNLADTNDLFAPTLEALRRHFTLPLPVQLIDVEIDGEGCCRPRALVLEPDYLTDVTAVAECFQPGGAEPLQFLIKKFLPVSTNKYLLLGHIANFFLDEFLSNPDSNFPETFPKAFRLNPLGFSMLSNSDIQEIYEKAKKHYVILKRVLQESFPAEGMKPEFCYLEPTFYSEVYGLQGRLDIFHRDDPAASIVELKSGAPFRANMYGIGATHFTQTLLYDLLIQSAFQGKINPKNYILYSGEENSPLRYAPRIKAQQYEALQVRNQLVSIERQLAAAFANNPAEPLEDSSAALLFSRLDPAHQPMWKGFAQKDLQAFSEMYRNLAPLERRYFLAFTGFIAREHLLAKRGVDGVDGTQGQAGLWLNSLSDKEASYDVLSHLKLVENHSGESPALLVFARTPGKTNELANFRKGDIAVLYPFTKGKSPLSNQIFKCTLLEIDQQRVLVRLRNPQFNQRLFEEQDIWNIEHDLLDNNFITQYRALYALLQAPTQKRGLLLSGAGPRKPDTPAPALSYPGMTEEQSSVLQAALRAPDYFLLWGPPGTGKTSVMLRYMVDWIFHHTEEHILLLAYTNRAVDEICEAIEQIGPFIREHYIRIGSSVATDPRFESQLLDAQIQPISTRQGIRDLLEKRRIFVGTIASFAGKQELMTLKSFQRVIIDEASQILEPMLTGILPHFKQFILIGDHKQLPAVVAQDERSSAVTDPELQKIGLVNMRNSLFERLYKQCIHHHWDWAYAHLSFQGRMHEEIMEFPNRYFYENQLHILPPASDPGRSQQASLSYVVPEGASPLEEMLCRKRVLFLPTPGDEESPTGKTNVHEARKLVELVKAFGRIYQASSMALHSHSIGIITPYRAQIAQILSCMGEAGIPPGQMTIDTVERYQGGARDIILISLCTNGARQLDSLVSLSEEGVDRKLNVALTRARQHVVILGNPELLSSNETYRKLMEEVNS